MTVVLAYLLLLGKQTCQWRGRMISAVTKNPAYLQSTSDNRHCKERVSRSADENVGAIFTAFSSLLLSLLLKLNGIQPQGISSLHFRSYEIWILLLIIFAFEFPPSFLLSVVHILK